MRFQSRVLLDLLVATFILALGGAAAGAAAPQPEKRIAFVVGDANYAAGALPTAANDAGLVAQTLQAAGFEVVGARDLDAETFRQSYGDFLKRVTDAGPETVAFVYVSGYGLQYGNENYYVPIGADVSRDLDIPVAAIRLSDLIGPLNALALKARFTVFDAAYKTPFKISGAPLAGGFSLVDASPGSLVAYNAAPGTVAPVAKENYGVYAQSLAAILREGGSPPDEIFDRVRLRVNEVSKGVEVPWDSSRIDATFRFFDRGKGAPPPAASPAQLSALNSEPLRDLPVQQAYTAAVARDTVQSYTDFSTTYGADPLAKRARVLLAARREAVTWRRTVGIDTSNAYWSYLSRYRRGPHAFDARMRLQALSAALEPPPSYQAIPYDVPPPPADEIVYEDRPVIYFADPGYDFPPPPPPPDYWLPPVPAAFLDLPPPPPEDGLFLLPVPVFVPLPDYYDPPPYVVVPVGNYFYGGGFGGGGGDVFVNNTQVINNIHQGFGPGGSQGGGGNGLRNAAIGAAAVALPVAVAARAAALQRRGITTPAQLNAAQRAPGGVNAVGGREGGQALPGANGRPLPAQNGVRAPAPGAAGRPGGVNPAAAARPGAPASAAARPKVAQPAAQAAKPNAAKPNAAAERRQAGQRQGTARQQRVEAQRAQRQEAQQRGAQQRAERAQRATQARQERAPQQARPQAQQARPAPQQARPQVQEARPQVQQARPQAPQGRPGGFGGGGFGGGGARPGGFGGGVGGGRPAAAPAPRAAPPAARPAPGGRPGER